MMHHFGLAWLRRIHQAGEQGVDVVEYALLCGLITLGTIPAVLLVSTPLRHSLRHVVHQLHLLH